MKQELDDKLCQKYPKIFADRHSDMKTTCMCWGFECGDGWYNLIDHLCANIQHHIDWQEKQGKPVAQVIATQVKEKFGTLRFYYDGGDDYIRGMVTLAESLSSSTCEGCGIPSKVQNEGGWYSNICPVCRGLREQERSKFMKDNGLEE